MTQQTAAQDKQLYSRDEAAAFLGVSTRSIDEWRKLGKLDSVRLGNRVKFRRAELERVVREGIA